jgi:hypothetical protein
VVKRVRERQLQAWADSEARVSLASTPSSGSPELPQSALPAT